MAGKLAFSLLTLILTLSGIFMGEDLFFVLLWWVCILFIGCIFLPVTKKYLGMFYDCGYLFSKTIGIGLVSYCVWLLSSLHVLPFSPKTIFLSLLSAIVIIFFVLKGFSDFRLLMKEKYKVFIYEEIIFLCGLIFWSFIRGLQPDIHGLEKFMNYGFVNSILRASSMPPGDMWCAGEPINYYYFGHYICAFLTKLTAINSSITYNLMVATLFSLTSSLTFSLTGNVIFLLGRQKFKKVIVGGMLSAFLLTCGGTLHTFIFAHLLPFAKSVNLYSSEIRSYWYPDATRYIGYSPPTEDKTIHEFPLYSFVVSDLHSHVFNIPFVLTFLAVALAYLVRPLRKFREKKRGEEWYAISGLQFLCAFLLAVFYMTNPWDFPIYLTIAGLVVVYKKFTKYHVDLKLMGTVVLRSVVTIFLCVLIVFPFLLHFIPFSQGIGVTHARSPLYQLLVLWGYQLLFVFCFFVLVASSWKKSFQFKKNSTSSLQPTDMFVLMLSLAAVGLIILPEIVYVKDIYLPSYHRANTMFKLTYQSFIMFGIVIGYITIRIFSREGRTLYHQVMNYCLILILALPMVYSFYAIKGYYGTPIPQRYRGLDGLIFLKKLYPGDFGAVQWLNENIPGQPVILEANGDSYTDYGRISMATGFPTIQGWFVHEWLWRSDREMISERVNEVATVYESDDLLSTQEILAKYNVHYIIIGKLERDKFKNLKEDKIVTLGKKVFDYQNTKIIHVSLTR